MEPIDPEKTESPNGPAWESRSAVGMARAFAATAQESAIRPTGFFRSLRPTGNVMDAALFGIGIVLAATLIQVGWAFVVTPIPFLLLSRQGLAPEVPLAMAALSSWIRILVTPVVAVFAFLFLAGVFHVGLIVLGAAKRPFETTFRVVCYSTAPLLLGIIPFCGDPIGKVWALVLVIVGLRECHGASPGQAIVSVLLPVLALGGCCGLLVSTLILGHFFAGG